MKRHEVEHCPTEGCTKCHCLECELARKVSMRITLQWDIRGVTFAWAGPNKFNLNLKLDLGEASDTRSHSG